MINHPFAVFKPIGTLPIDVQLVIIPFAKWHKAANVDEFTNQPRKH